MKYNNLSKEQLLAKIAKLELELIKSNNKIEGLEKAEGIVTQQSSILKFINSMAIPSADKSSIEELSKALLIAVKNYTGADLATFSLYKPKKKELLLLHIEVEQGVLKKVIKIAGEKIVKTASPVDDESYELIIKKLVAKCETFTEVTFGAIPKVIDKAIRSSTGIDRLYPIAHVIEGELYGTTMLAFKKGKASPSIELLESYAHLMSVSLRRYNAEKALQDSEIKYRTYIEHAPLGIIIANDKGKYIDVNPGASELLGYTRDELLQLSITDVIADEKDIGGFQKLKKEGELSHEIKLKKKNGLIVDIALDAVHLSNKQFIAFHTDITERKKAVKALMKAKEEAEESEANVTAIIEGTNDSIWAFNRKYELLYINNIFQQEFLKSFDVLLKPGMNLVEALPESLQPFWKPRYDRVLNNEQYTMEDAVPTENGILYIDVAFNPIVKNGQVIGGSCFGSNITSRKLAEIELQNAKEKAEESEQKLLVAQELSHVGSWEHLIDANVVTWSRELYNIFERSYNLPAPKYSEQRPFYTEKSFNLLDKAVQDCIQHEIPYEIELDIYTSTGSLKHIISKGNVKKDETNKIIGCFGTAQDITAQKKLELDLVKAKEKAEESDRLKSAFLANMSHEIRTPMNGILGFTSLLKEPGLNGNDQQKFIEIIEKSGDRMLNTINDIVDISKIEAGQVEVLISDIDLNKQLDDFFEFFLPEAKKKNLKLSLTNRISEQQVVFKSDKEKLDSILTNFIKNAIKYTPVGSIEFGYCINENRNQNELKFYVKDTGIGIPKERQDAIFSRFVQADIGDRQVYEGSGLGLAISKAYVEMLGGKIWVESEEGVGSNFYFTIPYNENIREVSGNNNSAYSKKQLSIKRKIKVLIVEDDEFAITYLNIILNDYTETILVAKTGIDAVEKCRKNPDIDIILMDIKIPGINGYEATQQIREFNKEVFILAQTAYAQSGDREKCIEAGCNDYVSKPINKDKLLEIISSHL